MIPGPYVKSVRTMLFHEQSSSHQKMKVSRALVSKKQKRMDSYFDGMDSRATIHLISSSETGYGNDGDLERRSLSIKKLESAYPGLTKMMKRGDIIEDIDQSGYRSEGVYLFDGKNVVEQNDEYDDYGSPPEDFKIITEFQPGHWDQPLEVNDKYVSGNSEFYWHSEDLPCAIDPIESGLRDAIKNNLQRENEEYYVVFTHNKLKYLVYLRDDYVKNIDTLKVMYGHGQRCDEKGTTDYVIDTAV